MINELIRKTKEFLSHRQQAYQQIFNEEVNFSKAVLEDLSKFCRAEITTFHADARISAVLEGRREVWLRIQDHLKLNPEDLWKKYGKGSHANE